MRSRFDFANPRATWLTWSHFSVAMSAFPAFWEPPVKTLHMPWLPLYLIAVCAYQPVLDRHAAIAALVMAVVTIAAEVLSRHLTTRASEKCRGANRQASPAYWI
jgi:hypothetical protein